MSENLKRIKIIDPDNPPAPVGGGRWVQDGDYMVQIEPPTAMPNKPVNPKAEVVPVTPKAGASETAPTLAQVQELPDADSEANEEGAQ